MDLILLEKIFNQNDSIFEINFPVTKSLLIFGMGIVIRDNDYYTAVCSYLK